VPVDLPLTVKGQEGIFTLSKDFVTSYKAVTELIGAAPSEAYTTIRALVAEEKVDDDVRAELLKQISDHELLWTGVEPLPDSGPFLGVGVEELDLDQAVVDEDPLVTAIRTNTVAVAVMWLPDLNPQWTVSLLTAK
jgi:hypothetical protein